MKLSTTLVMLSPFSTDSPPLAIENIPPVKSIKILKIDHPFVLFLLQFQTAGGVYLTKVITNFA